MAQSSRLVNRLRLKHLSLISALGETQTLHDAAQRVSITQPSATKMLADVENAFGFKLFDRHARGMRPTTLGKEVIAFSLQTEASLERFVEGLEIKRRGGHGNLVVGAIMGAAPDVVATAVRELKRERPRLKIRILGETSDQIAALLDRHEIELGVGRLTEPLQHNKHDFTALCDEPLRVVVRSEHPLARKRKLDWHELVAWPWVLQTIATPARALLEEEFANAGVSTPDDVIECTSIFATLQLVESSDAVAVLPESVIRNLVKARLLHALPFVVGRGLKQFGVLTRKGEPVSEVAASFIAHLRRSAEPRQG